MVGVLEVNKLIVESKNDKFFIERLIKILNLQNIEVSEPICLIDECICLDGLGNLEKKLRDEKLDSINKIGILLDADNEGVSKRIDEINKILKNLDINIEFDNINEFQKDEKKDIEVACHILNIEDRGSLDNILKTIAKNSSPYADCLESWKKCLEEKEEKVSDPIFTKFWVNNYLRFDTCTKEEQKQISEKCNFEKALEKDVWNFEHQALDSLKDFLKLFQ